MRFARMTLIYLSYQMKMYLSRDINNIGKFLAISMWIINLVSCVTPKIVLFHLVDCYNLVYTVSLLICCM